MTNGELFIKENPNVEVKINGSCVWIYYFDGVNHYTMPVEWWDKEIGLFEDIRAEINAYGSIWVQYQIKGHTDHDIEGIVEDVLKQAKQQVLDVIDKHIRGGE